jgi:hypothetical protein
MSAYIYEKKKLYINRYRRRGDMGPVQKKSATIDAGK